MRVLKEAPYLKIFHDKNADSIEIIANKSGLEDLADICQRLATKDLTKPQSRDHFHLFVGINLVNGSNETVITFDPKIAASKQDYDPVRFDFLKNKYRKNKDIKKK